MSLLTADQYSAHWGRMRKHLDARIAELSRSLENDLEATDTARLRGRISELRKLIATVEVEPEDQETQASVPFI